MNSGQWLTLYGIGGFTLWAVVFIAWELINLKRKRDGNKSSLTLSQYTVREAKSGAMFWRAAILVIPIFFLCLGTWLLFHFEGLCINFNVMCGLDI